MLRPDNALRTRRRRAVCSAICLSAGLAASSHAQTRSWLGGNGLWSNPLQWSPTDVPNSPPEAALIPGVAPFTVSLDIPVQLVGVSVTNPSAVLSINPGMSLSVGTIPLNSGLANSGLIQANGGPSLLTHIRFPAGGVITGSGIIRLGADSSSLDSAFISADPTFSWTNSAGHTIAGTGRLYGPITNAGSITADSPGQILQIAGDVTNTGSIGAISTGILELAQGARLSGGGLTNGPASTIRIADLAGLASMAVSGTVAVAPEARLEIGAGALSGTFDLSISASSTLSPTSAVATGAATLGGGGTSFTTLNSGAGAQSFLDSEAGAITIAPGHTIRGSGRVYAPLAGVPTLRATDSGKSLDVLGDVDMTGGGSMQSSASGAILNLGSGDSPSNPTITGGSLGAIAGAFVRIQPFSSPLLKGTALSGNVEVLGGARLRTDASGLSNAAVILVNSAGESKPTGLRLTQSATISGAGAVSLNANPADMDSALLDGVGPAVLTNGPGHTLRGTGRIAIPVTNQGTISASNPTGPLLITANVTNSGAGAVSASNAVLQLAGGMTMSGGSFTGFGTGRLAVPRGELGTLSGFTITAMSIAQVLGGGILQLEGTVTNNGSIIVNPAGEPLLSRLRATSSSEIVTGVTGSVMLNGVNNVSLVRFDGPASPAVLTLGSGQTLRGSGTIGGNVLVKGTIAPGFPPSTAGQFVFEDSPALDTGSSVDFKLVSNSAYDRLAMARPYTLSGPLKISLIGAYNPNSVQLFKLIDGQPGATRTGTFSPVAFPVPPASVVKRRWLLTYQAEDVLLRLTCAADFNGDGLVNDLDFQTFVVAYDDLICPDAPDPCPCDLNGDGLVNDEDFVFFNQAYNLLICQ